MTDVHSKAVRSYNMSRIRSKDTKPELLLRKALHKLGLRYKLHDRLLPGKPDIVLPKYKTVIFVHGCFWHRHEGCKYSVLPKTRQEWWETKLNRNVEKDLETAIHLQEMGWKVITVWECDLKPTAFSDTLAKIVAELKKAKDGQFSKSS